MENFHNKNFLTKEQKEKNLNDFWVALREMPDGPEKAKIACDWSGTKYLNLGKKIIKNTIGCQRCIHMNWPASLQAKGIVCESNPKIKKGKCVNIDYPGASEDDSSFVVAYVFTIAFLGMSIFLYLKSIL